MLFPENFAPLFTQSQARHWTSDFLERATSATNNVRILQRVASDFLRRLMSDFLQWAPSATSNEWFIVTSNFCKK